MAASDRVSINEALPLLQDVVEWEELGFHLGLSDAAIKEIRAMVGETVSIKRMVMMSRWVQSDLEATWSKLAKALLKMNPPYKVLAAKIRQQYSCPSSEASVTHQDGQKERQEPNGEKYVVMSTSNEEEIKRHFSTLLSDVRKALQSHDVDVADLLEFMNYFFEQNECFTNVTSIRETFTAVTVNRLWSYYHYSPLERLTKRFLPTDPEIKKLMTEYKSQLTGFQLTTKLIDYIKEKKLPGDDDTDQPTKFTAEHYRKIKVVIQLERKVSELSLMYVQELWSSFAEEFNIPSLTAIVHHIAPGSLEITWCVPPHEAELIRPTARFCRQHKITAIAIDDHIIYDEKQMVEYERRFLELCCGNSADTSNFIELLQLGVDPNICDEVGHHPLWYASGHRRNELVELLMDHGAAVDMQTDEIGETALHAASKKGDVNAMTVLVQRGADVDSLTKTGATPLEYASKWGTVEAVHLLLDNGADIDKGELSPLWAASYEGRVDVVEALLDRGAKVNLPNDDEIGETALHAASKKGDVNAMTVLIQRGADVNSLTKTGETPLAYASDVEAVHLLLDSGADIHKGELSPLWAASSEGRMDVVEALLDRGVKVNLPNDDEIGETALHAASRHGHVNVMTVLVQGRADVNSLTKTGVTPLKYASKWGTVEAVHLLLDSGADIDKGEESPLWGAAYEGRVDAVEALLDQGAKVNLQTDDETGETALHAASRHSHLNVMTVLVQRGADMNSITKEGLTPLAYASKWGTVEAVHLLLDSGADMHKGEESPLWGAAYEARVDAVEALLDRGAKVNLPNDDEIGETALHAASCHCHLNVMTVLVQRGADVNSLTKTGVTPLAYASKVGTVEAVHLLLDSGADIDKGERSPLWAASYEGRVDVIEALLDRGVKVNLPTDEEFSESALNTACGHGHVDVASLLIRRGADINYKTKKGWTPLLHATLEGYSNVVKLLIQHQVQLEIENNEGRTALLVACWEGHYDIAYQLLQAGANPNAQDQEALTALILATQKGHSDIITALMDANADPNMTEKTYGWSAIFFAAKEGNVKIVQELISRKASVELKDKTGVTAYDIAKESGHQAVCDELERHINQESKTEITKDQQEQVQKSSNRFMRIFDYLEKSLLRGRTEKKRKQQDLMKGTSSNILESRQHQEKKGRKRKFQLKWTSSNILESR